MHSVRSFLCAALTAGLAAATAASAQVPAPPELPLPEPAARGENVTHVKNLKYGTLNNGTDLEFHTYTLDGVKRTFAFAGSYREGLQIVDVTDPANAEIVAVYECGVSQGDVQVFERDGKVYAAYTHDPGYASFDATRGSTCRTEARALGFTVPNTPAGTFIADVTDPYNPTTVSFVNFGLGSHNQTVHPSGKYLYNSNSEIAGLEPGVEIADISDLSKPKLVTTLPMLLWPGLGSDAHDIKFNASGTRAYVAAISHTEILDTTNPAAPKSIGQVLDPYINVHHQSETVTLTDPVLGARDYLLIEDEFAGATGTGECPSGGVFVYDVTGPLEAAPLRVGYWNISDVGLTENGGPVDGVCTAHVFQVDEKSKMMTLAYYNAGVRVIDISGLIGASLGKAGVTGMKEVGFFRFPDSNSWAVKAPSLSRDGFFMFSNDHSRGFDVFKYTPGPAVSSPGAWLNSVEVEQTLALRRSLSREDVRAQTICLLKKRA